MLNADQMCNGAFKWWITKNREFLGWLYVSLGVLLLYQLNYKSLSFRGGYKKRQFLQKGWIQGLFLVWMLSTYLR